MLVRASDAYPGSPSRVAKVEVARASEIAIEREEEEKEEGEGGDDESQLSLSLSLCVWWVCAGGDGRVTPLSP